MDFYKLLAFAVVTGICSPASAQSKGPVDVYIIAGQSNATGQAIIRNMADTMKYDTTVMIFHSGKPHLNSGKPAFTWHALYPTSEVPEKFGPELSFGTRLHQLYPQTQIALIKHSHSGTNLYKEWNPGKNERDTSDWGPQYKVFVHTVDSGMNALRKMGYTPVIRGMIWQQGENDAMQLDNASILYAHNLVHFIARVRKQFNLPKMRFVYGYILPTARKDIYRTNVLKAEHDIDENSGSEIAVKNAILVQTADLSQRSYDKNTLTPLDHNHFGTDGIWVLGLRMAQKFAPAKSH
jgi:hypothetical protein